MIFTKSEPLNLIVCEYNTLTGEWHHSLDDYSNEKGYISYYDISNLISYYEDCLRKGKKIKLNLDFFDDLFNGCVLTTDSELGLRTQDDSSFEVYPIDDFSNSTGSGSDTAKIYSYYVSPKAYTFTNSNNNYNMVVYTATDTGTAAVLPAHAELTANMSDENAEDTWAAVEAEDGAELTLSILHDTLIDRDFTDITYNGTIHGKLEAHETENGVVFEGIDTGTIEMTSPDGTTSGKTVNNVSEGTKIEVSVNESGEFEVKSIDASLRSIYVNGENIADADFHEGTILMYAANAKENVNERKITIIGSDFRVRQNDRKITAVRPSDAI